MSQVLVSPPPVPVSMIPVVETEEPPAPQIHFSAVSFAGEASAASMDEKRMASRLAYLASQHHTSEYNRLKFGPAGSPVIYIPLSIHMPTQVQEMRTRQIQNAQKRTWWPSEPGGAYSRERIDLDQNQSRAQDCNLEPQQQENVVPCIQVSIAQESEMDDLTVNLGKPVPVPPLNHPPALNLRRELSMAMSSPLSKITIPQLSLRDTCQQLNLDIHAKTSESHPINISSIVPVELLPLISSHLTPTPPHTAYMYDLPPSLFLSHATLHASIATTHASVAPSVSARPFPVIRTPSEGVWTQLSGSGQPPTSLFPAIWQSPFSNDISEPHVTVDKWTSTERNEQDIYPAKSFQPTGIRSESTVYPQNAPTISPTSTAEPAAPHESLLSLPTSQARPHSAPPSLMLSHALPPGVLINEVAGSSLLPELEYAMCSGILNNDSDRGRSGKLDVQPMQLLEGINVSPPATWTNNRSSPPVPSIPVLGNMLLSSCPGKKVRLNGPVKGRGAICRDLGHDLKRVRALGVGCVICCLDDEELEFLGASWPQYSEVARKVGLDVLRIPIPEGLGPATPAQLDGHLSHIIHFYTLKGVPVLVHCRGGVGRAGLIACCWMLKLGLCGWLPLATSEANNHAYQGRDRDVAKVRNETIHLVERVIAVVRRRRSVKAIETYEQVRFLVEFVEYLQMSGKGFS